MFSVVFRGPGEVWTAVCGQPGSVRAGLARGFKKFLRALCWCADWNVIHLSLRCVALAKFFVNFRASFLRTWQFLGEPTAGRLPELSEEKVRTLQMSNQNKCTRLHGSA